MSRLTSGVSAGQIMPHSVLCSWRGRANFPSRPMGEFRRRRWDKVDAKVNLKINAFYKRFAGTSLVELLVVLKKISEERGGLGV